MTTDGIGSRSLVRMRRTNIDLDEKLLQEAMTLTGIRTKKGLVDHALKELVRRTKRNKKMLDLEGKIKWSGSLRKMREDRA